MQMTPTRRAVFSMKEVIAALKYTYPDAIGVALLPDDLRAAKEVSVGGTKDALTITWGNPA